MRHVTKYRWLLVGTLGLLTGVAAWAAPFSVKRSASAGDVLADAPQAIVVSSPFDDVAGSLEDGRLHYYAVIDDAGDSIRISVHKNSPQGAVRIAFDDNDPLSAASDAGLSSAVAAPAIAVADGVSTVTITIVPRDSSGIALGTGLSIVLDAGTLWPAVTIGSIVDHGDGSYTVRLASLIPISGSVAIGVEGVWLDSEPAFEFTDSGSGTLREQAIDGLEDLAGSGGQFEELMARFAVGSAEFLSLNNALWELGKALDFLDMQMDVKAFEMRLTGMFDELQDAHGSLSGQDRDDVMLLMDRLAENARMIAVHHIAEGEALCGVCGTVGSGNLCMARERLDEGDQQRAQDPPDYIDAMMSFAEAIEFATEDCGGGWDLPDPPGGPRPTV